MRPLSSCALVAGLLIGPGGLASAQVEPAERRLGAADRIPLPLTVVPELELPRGNWKHNAGWAPHDLEVRHSVEGGGLVVRLLDGDGYSAAPLELCFEAGAAGRLSAFASGGTYGCTRQEPFVDLHGEIRVEERDRTSAEPLRVSFRVDALDRGLLPLRTEGAVAIPLAVGEWEHDVCSPAKNAEMAVLLREVLWRWPDGSPRALGLEDGSGLRQGLWQTWHENGAVQSITEFHAGERHGAWLVLEQMGDFLYSCEGRMQHGRRSGEWIEAFSSDDKVEVYRERH